MNRVFRAIAFVMAFCLLIGTVACSEKIKNAADLNPDPARYEKPVGYQLELPQKGEEIAVITTSVGVMKLRFFEDAAPKAVYNFKQLAKSGCYDGQIFYRVINDFMIQTGSGTGTSSGGKSVWGKAFEDEFAPNLFNIRGAVSMANAGADTNGSQFFINQARPEAFYGWDYFEAVFEQYYKADVTAATQKYGAWINTDELPDEAKTLYAENGGNPSLDGWYNTNETGHTVFAQVFEGLDVLDTIASATTDANDKPVEDIKIESVKLETY